jgi:16S rRNA (guanine527-N7)-methyltransferase
MTMQRLYSGAKKLGLQLSHEQLELFQTYYRELVDWNKRLNLTTITEYEEVQINHFLDALTVVLGWQPPEGDNTAQVIDVGTGAGIPGIPLKIVFPAIGLVLLEATAKKAVFLENLTRKLGLEGIEIVIGRAEEVAHLSQYRERFDVVLSRAVAPLPALVELTLPFCTTGGRLIAHKKGAISPEVNQAAAAIKALGGSLRDTKAVELKEFPDRRWLVLIDKVSPTPGKYPRRPGIPAKRPLL